MRAVLIIACLCVMSAAQRIDRRVQGLTRVFSISVEEANRCLHKTDATVEDFDALEEAVSNPEIEPASLESARKASCAVVCAAQSGGLMVGAKLQMAKIHAFVDQCPMSENTKELVHRIVDICREEMKADTDECSAGLQFARCLVAKAKK